MNLIPQPPEAPRAEDGRRLVLHAVDWRTYEKFLDAIGNRCVRVTYDRGVMELMAPTWNHEWWKHRIGLVVLFLARELGLEVQGGGSTTFRRQDLERGLEPDECFYIQNVARMLGLRELDLSRDPPPDLAIEVEISTRALDRMGIYAALGVGELWRFDGRSLSVYLLRPDGRYELSEKSACFPTVPMSALFEFLRQTEGHGDLALFDLVPAWAREHGLNRR